MQTNLKTGDRNGVNDRYDFRNAKYFSRDFPTEVKAQVESLYCFSDLADLAKKQHLAAQLFAEALLQAAETYQSWSFSAIAEMGNIS